MFKSKCSNHNIHWVLFDIIQTQERHTDIGSTIKFENLVLPKNSSIWLVALDNINRTEANLNLPSQAFLYFCHLFFLGIDIISNNRFVKTVESTLTKLALINFNVKIEFLLKCPIFEQNRLILIVKEYSRQILQEKNNPTRVTLTWI